MEGFAHTPILALQMKMEDFSHEEKIEIKYLHNLEDSAHQ